MRARQALVGGGLPLAFDALILVITRGQNGCEEKAEALISS